MPHPNSITWRQILNEIRTYLHTIFYLCTILRLDKWLFWCLICKVLRVLILQYFNMETCFKINFNMAFLQKFWGYYHSIWKSLFLVKISTFLNVLVGISFEENLWFKFIPGLWCKGQRMECWVFSFIHFRDCPTLR